MSNPFEPPKANLEVPRELGPAPRAVKIAFALLCFSASIALLQLAAAATGLVGLPAGVSLGMSAISTLFGIAVIMFFAWKIRTGRNWARWVFAIWTLLGLVGFAASLAFMPGVWKAAPAHQTILGASQGAIQLAAIILTFTAQSRAWYRGSRDAVA